MYNFFLLRICIKIHLASRLRKFGFSPVYIRREHLGGGERFSNTGLVPLLCRFCLHIDSVLISFKISFYDPKSTASQISLPILAESYNPCRYQGTKKLLSVWEKRVDYLCRPRERGNISCLLIVRFSVYFFSYLFEVPFWKFSFYLKSTTFPNGSTSDSMWQQGLKSD